MAESKTSCDFTTIRRGSRVRHSADGAEGRITWCNGVSVKIEWDDGEKVTWKRAELSAKSLEILDDQTPGDAGEQNTSPVTAETAEAATEQAAQLAPGGIARGGCGERGPIRRARGPSARGDGPSGAGRVGHA
jgi:hypothetical protein